MLLHTIRVDYHFIVFGQELKGGQELFFDDPVIFHQIFDLNGIKLTYFFGHEGVDEYLVKVLIDNYDSLTNRIQYMVVKFKNIDIIQVLFDQLYFKKLAMDNIMINKQ